MEREAEDPTWHLSMLHPLVFELSNVEEVAGSRGMFKWGGFKTTPLKGSMFPALDEHLVNGIHSVGKLVATEINVGWENLRVAQSHVFEHAGSRIHDREMRDGVEKTLGGDRCELLQALDNHQITIADIDTTKEDIETVCNEGGVKVGGYQQKQSKVCHGCQVNDFVQGCLEHPRDASHIQHNCLLVRGACLGGTRKSAVHCSARSDQRPSYRYPKTAEISG